jgi:hypothetical protein
MLLDSTFASAKGGGRAWPAHQLIRSYRIGSDAPRAGQKEEPQHVEAVLSYIRGYFSAVVQKNLFSFVKTAANFQPKSIQ